MNTRIKFAFAACIMLFSSAAFSGAIQGSINFIGVGNTSEEFAFGIVSGTSETFDTISVFTLVDSLSTTLFSWTVGDFNYTSTDWWFVTEEPDNVLIRGYGMLNATGYTSTLASLVVSAQPLNGGTFSGEGDTDFSFLATTTAVPEPQTLALLGIALLTFGVFRISRSRS